MEYSVFFDYDNTTYRLPVNPEQIEVSSSMAIETYEILKLGQIAVPAHRELKKYSFECEFPSVKTTPFLGIPTKTAIAMGLQVEDYMGFPHYVETPGDFKDADFYVNLFEEWRDKLVPVRFIASNGTTDDINTMVLIEELTITEKAGEEGDKYISFKLMEYRNYGKALATVNKKTGKKKKAATSQTNPKSSGYYVVKSGDSLWAIARKYYGDGTQSVKIYNANKDKIKNPSLIYPGQRLVIP